MTVPPVSESVYTYLDENQETRNFSYLLTVTVPTEKKKKEEKIDMKNSGNLAFLLSLLMNGINDRILLDTVLTYLQISDHNNSI